MKKRLLIPALAILLWPQTASAHCPLCVVGAGGAALLAKWLGVSTLSLGLFIGAFAIAVGYWFARLLARKFKKRSIYLGTAIVIFSFFSTVLPILSMMPGYTTISIFWGGEYGSIFNRTYLINLFFVGSVIGGLYMILSPRISRALTKLRKNRTLPFQGIIITFLLLLITAVIFELLT